MYFLDRFFPSAAELLLKWANEREEIPPLTPEHERRRRPRRRGVWKAIHQPVVRQIAPEDELELPDLEDHVRGDVAAELDADASRQAPINEEYIVKADSGIKMEADVLDSDH